MTFFGLDTAGRTVSAALLQDGQLVCESFLNTGLTHSETLMGLVDGAFRSAGLGPADVDVWGVCSGPGSFTGLRIGLAAVKGMAFPTGALCAPVSTLEALAQGCPGGEGTVLTALDARRGQVYWAAFDLAPGHARLAPDAAAPVHGPAPGAGPARREFDRIHYSIAWPRHQQKTEAFCNF